MPEPHSENPHFFPSLNLTPSMNTDDDDDDDDHTKYETNYNHLISNHECILSNLVRKPNMETYTHAYIRAGPRKLLHFDPQHVSAAIVTCGGLCPGLNNVIREIVKTLHQSYGIAGKVYGIQGGYRGFHELQQYPPIELTPELVQNIHHEGGTVLGSSRGGFDIEKIVDFMQTRHINQLYVIGGDGTHRGAFKIHEACMERVRVPCYVLFCAILCNVVLGRRLPSALTLSQLHHPTTLGSQCGSGRYSENH